MSTIWNLDYDYVYGMLIVSIYKRLWCNFVDRAYFVGLLVLVKTEYKIDSRVFSSFDKYHSLLAANCFFLLENMYIPERERETKYIQNTFYKSTI